MTEQQAQSINAIITKSHVGRIEVVQQGDMVKVVEGYISIRKGVKINLEPFKGLDIDLLYLYPDQGLKELRKLDSAYSCAKDWLTKNEELWMEKTSRQ